MFRQSLTQKLGVINKRQALILFFPAGERGTAEYIISAEPY